MMFFSFIFLVAAPPVPGASLAGTQPRYVRAELSPLWIASADDQQSVYSLKVSWQFPLSPSPEFIGHFTVEVISCKSKRVVQRALLYPHLKDSSNSIKSFVFPGELPADEALGCFQVEVFSNIKSGSNPRGEYELMKGARAKHVINFAPSSSPATVKPANRPATKPAYKPADDRADQPTYKNYWFGGKLESEWKSFFPMFLRVFIIVVAVVYWFSRCSSPPTLTIFAAEHREESAPMVARLLKSKNTLFKEDLAAESDFSTTHSKSNSVLAV